MTNSTAWKGFEIFRTTDVPVIRASTALPLPWAQMLSDYEAEDRTDEEKTGIVVPRSWWIEVRGESPDAKNSKGELVLTADNMAARIKASFSGFRAGIEKQRDDGLLPVKVTIEEQQDKAGNWESHRILLMPDDVEAREAAIRRGQAVAAKKKKEAARKAKAPAKKTAAK